MRIGVLTSVGRTLDAFFQETVQQWQQQGHVVRCAAGTRPTADLPFDLVDGLTQRPSPANVTVPSRLESWARLHGLDVVLTNTATASTLVRLKRMPCKVTYFCHGLHWNDRWHPAQVVERALLGRADSVVTINSDDREWFAARHPRVFHLREGVGVPDSYPWTPLPPADDGIRLVWAGDFVPRKRPLVAVDIVREVSRLAQPAHLTMLGDGPLLDETIAHAASSSVDELITFAGRTDVRPHLAGAHALLHTATWEGLPRILLEGMSMGRRAYAFDVKGVRDVPEAILEADGDVSALARRIVAQPPTAAVDREISETFRVEAVAARLLDHLEDVVG